MNWEKRIRAAEEPEAVFPQAGTPVRPRLDATQLSAGNRVIGDVGSIALDRVVLGAGSPQPGSGLPVDVDRGRLTDPGMLGMLSDAEVMLRVAAGDDSAFDYLVEKYRRPMVSFMYRMTRNQSVAEELAQEVFLRVYRSRQTYAAS